MRTTGASTPPAAGEWVDVPHMPGTFVCNIGDMMERWTNDLFRSTVHRVVNRVRRERYSVAFFTGPTPETMVGVRGGV